MIAADATEWQGGPFDAVLVDAPCSSTGTIRRHPDVAWLKSETDIAQLTGLQRRLLDRAVALTKPGGRLVYCVCSLEPEEGEQQIEALLAREPALRRVPIEAGEIGGIAEFVNAARRPAHAALPLGTIPTRAWAGSTASSPPGLELEPPFTATFRPIVGPRTCLAKAILRHS